MNTPLLGLPFFEYNAINILTSTGMLQLPNMTLQLNSMLKPLQNSNPQKSKSCNKNINLLTKSETTLKPFTMEIIECEPEGEWKHQEITGVVEPSKRLETSLKICLTNAICTVQEGTVKVGIMNLNEHDLTGPRGITIAKLTVPTLDQVKHLIPIDVNLCQYLERNHPWRSRKFPKRTTPRTPGNLP